MLIKLVETCVNIIDNDTVNYFYNNVTYIQWNAYKNEFVKYIEINWLWYIQ